MVSLPTEINTAQEKLLHNILDEGINELRKSSADSIPARSYEPPIADSPLISVKQRVQPPVQRSSALLQVLEEIKNGGTNVSDPPVRDSYASVPAMSRTAAAPENVQNELTFLQSKVRQLEERLGSASLSSSTVSKPTIMAAEPREEFQHYATVAPREEPALAASSKLDLDTSIKSIERSSHRSSSRKKSMLRSSSNLRNSRSKTRSVSVSSMRESFADSLTRSNKVQDKYVGLREKYEGAKQQLVKERQKCFDLAKKLEKYEREYNMKRSVYEELREAKGDYDQLKVSFEKSEKLRRHQKEVIAELQEEVARLKGGDVGAGSGKENGGERRERKKAVNKEKGGKKR